MEIVWERGEVTANEVLRVLLHSRTIAGNTVRTLLERMEDKGWLKRAYRAPKAARDFSIRPARPPPRSIGQKVRKIVDTICGGSPETLVTALLDYRGLRPDELKRIRQILDQAKASKGQKGGA